MTIDSVEMTGAGRTVTLTSGQFSRATRDMGKGYVDRLKDLQEHVKAASKMLWERIQMGNFDGPAAAVAAMKAYEHINKAEAIIEDNLSQLPLPLLYSGGFYGSTNDGATVSDNNAEQCRGLDTTTGEISD